MFKKPNTNPIRPLIFLLRPYCTGSHPTGHDLYSRISPLGSPTLSMVPVLEQWVHEGKTVREFELRRIIRGLRGRRRYTHALEISEWMSSEGHCPFSPGDRAVQLDLIGKVRGLDAAESYFDRLSGHEKTIKTYGALLNCYVRECLVDKSISHMQKMKEMGFGFSTINYNDLMCLYSHTGQLEKIPDVLSDMKNDGVFPDIFSYRICINSYGARSDLKNMEKLLKELEKQPHVSIDWITYSTVANAYVKAGSKEKALIYLKKLEAELRKDAIGYNHLISFYASMGKKDDVRRLWSLEKAACKKLINRDYVVMLGSLVKLGELEEARVLLQEWESSCQFYDFRVPNVLLIGYCQKGLIEQAEALLQEIIDKGKTPIPNSWAIIAAAYLNKGDMEKTFKSMKNALEVKEENPGWRPKPVLISGILSWLKDKGEVEKAEAFVDSLKAVTGFDTKMLGLE